MRRIAEEQFRARTGLRVIEVSLDPVNHAASASDLERTYWSRAKLEFVKAGYERECDHWGRWTDFSERPFTDFPIAPCDVRARKKGDRAVATSSLTFRLTDLGWEHEFRGKRTYYCGDGTCP